jgi:hypothetical protein
MSARRTCRACRKHFEGEPWQRLCWPCWRAQKEAQERREDAQEREDAYQRGYYKGRIDGLAAGHHDGFVEGLAAGHSDARRRQAKPAPPLDVKLIAQAISLCHPDRHPPERFEIANAVTAGLNALREGP